MADLTQAKIISVWRPEVAELMDGTNPFEAIEILAIVTDGDEDDVNRVLNEYSAENPDWKFAIEPVTQAMLV